MTFFTEIIFIPKSKPVEQIRVLDNSTFEYWISGTDGNKKVLWVKCPVCYHTYSLDCEVDQKTTVYNLEEFKAYYCRKIIRLCPKHSEHLEIENINKLFRGK